MAVRMTGLAAFVIAAGAALAASGLWGDRQAAGQAPAGAPGTVSAAGPPAGLPAAPSADVLRPADPAFLPPAAANITQVRQLDVFSRPDAVPYLWADASTQESEQVAQARREIHRLEAEAQAILAEYAAAETDAKAAVKTRLQEAIQQQFDARQQERNLQIADLEEQVKRLRDLHQKREAAKAEIVESRLAQLIRSTEGLGWDGGDGPERRTTLLKSLHRVDVRGQDGSTPAARN